MASLRRLTNVRKSALFYQSIRNHWNKDFKPGPYPRTPEEREAAAKKYGLLPEEYQGHWGSFGPPCPFDISGESKDPYYPWDFPEHKRNFNETLHVQADMIGEDRFDISGRPRFTLRQQVLAFLGVMGFFAGTYHFLQSYKMFRPVLPKQYPQDGPHYTFEPANK
ncbi:hypothetical protein B566_EDAN008560 [Ephemera danica]|nr:hypothetical protein B566_EDAN008560 [Ephemera danica]